MIYKTKFTFNLIPFITAVICLLSSETHSQAPDHENSSSTTQSIFLADPAIFVHEDNYYLYGTSGNNPNLGFEVFISEDLETWKSPEEAQVGYALRSENVFGDKGFWAPHVFHHKEKFYMAYTANEQIAMAVADHPAGPFIQTEKIPLSAPVKQIDPFVFIDEDEKIYLYHVRLTEGNRLYVAEMEENFSAIIPETLKECIIAEEDWENTQNAPWPVAEGPTVIKHNGLYYFIYSANDFRNPDYAVGYAVGDSPYGPWKKFSGNPILSRNEVNQHGPGHGDFFKDAQGNYRYVFHTHYSNDQVSPRRTAVVKATFEKANNDGIDLLKIDASIKFIEKTD